MGYSIAEREEMRRWDEEEAAMGLGLLGTMVDADPTVPGSPNPTPAPKPQPAIEGGDSA
ncbi:hypothetical protein [Paraburkholderia bengalensis]